MSAATNTAKAPAKAKNKVVTLTGLVESDKRDKTRTVVVRFHLPGTHGSMTLVPSARVPAEQWTYQGTQVTDERPVTFSW